MKTIKTIVFTLLGIALTVGFLVGAVSLILALPPLPSFTDTVKGIILCLVIGIPLILAGYKLGKIIQDKFKV